MKIAILASGAGSNAAEIIKTLPNFIKKESASIAVLISNNEKAGIKNIANLYDLPFEILFLKNKNEDEQSKVYAEVLNQYEIDFIVLAGYLKKLPIKITNTFTKRIVNIHPALLPAYGGAGMYGRYVHEAVIASGELQSGITVHYVDEVYDHGQIIFQAKCVVEINDKAEDLAKKVLALEHKYYTTVIAETILSQIPVK